MSRTFKWSYKRNSPGYRQNPRLTPARRRRLTWIGRRLKMGAY